MKIVAPLVLVLAVLAPRFATAAESQEDPVALEKSIEDQSTALSTDDCDTACKALASMQRATDRLCKMDPGPSCSRARTAVDSAARRVRDACPACASAFANPPPPAPPPSPDVGAKTEATNMTEPPAESRRGGCAGCDAGGMPPASDAALFALAWLVARRKRAKRGRRRSS